MRVLSIYAPYRCSSAQRAQKGGSDRGWRDDPQEQVGTRPKVHRRLPQRRIPAAAACRVRRGGRLQADANSSPSSAAATAGGACTAPVTPSPRSTQNAFEPNPTTGGAAQGLQAERSPARSTAGTRLLPLAERSCERPPARHSPLTSVRTQGSPDQHFRSLAGSRRDPVASRDDRASSRGTARASSSPFAGRSRSRPTASTDTRTSSNSVVSSRSLRTLARPGNRKCTPGRWRPLAARRQRADAV